MAPAPACNRTAWESGIMQSIARSVPWWGDANKMRGIGQSHVWRRTADLLLIVSYFDFALTFVGQSATSPNQVDGGRNRIPVNGDGTDMPPRQTSGRGEGKREKILVSFGGGSCSGRPGLFRDLAFGSAARHSSTSFKHEQACD